MSKNYMPEVAKILGVEIGEEFDVFDADGEIRKYGPYEFTDEAIVDCVGNGADDWLLFCLLTGRYTLQKRPWRPKEGGMYWYCSAQDGYVYWAIFCTGMTRDLAFLNMGNCFPSKEVAEAAVPEMLAKFEEMKKEVRG